MNLRYYTDKEINELQSNIFINEIKNKRTIQYNYVFKLWCVMMRLEMPYLTAKDIFKRGGFNISILHNDLPRKRINEWIRNYKKYGKDYFLPETNYYTSLNKKVDNPSHDDFIEKLLNVILYRLNKLDEKK